MGAHKPIPPLDLRGVPALSSATRHRSAALAAITPRPGQARHDVMVALWIAGAGGLGREALDVALAAGLEVKGFLDDARSGESIRGLPVRRPGDIAGGDDYLVGIGDPMARLALAARLDAAGGRPRSLVHPRSIVGPETTVTPGALIMGGAHVSSTVMVGAHAQVHYGATVGHDAILESAATVLPGANVAGAVVLGRGALVGTGAVILQGRHVGSGAVVGAGAVVTRDVAPAVTVIGVPARDLKLPPAPPPSSAGP